MVGEGKYGSEWNALLFTFITYWWERASMAVNGMHFYSPLSPIV
jgi:hypothetical protein